MSTTERVVDAPEADNPLFRHEGSLRSFPAYVWALLGALFFNMFAGNAYLLGLPVGLDRPLFVLAVALLLLDSRTERLRFTPVIPVMALTVAWTAWSWLSTGSATDTAKAFALSDRIGVPFAMFLLGPLVFSTAARRDLLLKLMTLIGIYLGWTAIFEVTQMTSLVWPRFINDPSIGLQFGRARGPFLASEPLGMTAGICFFLAGLLAARTRGNWRWASFLSMVLSLAAVLLSMTRTNWAAVLLGILLIGLLVPALRRWVPVAFGLFAAVLAGVLVAVPSLYDQLDSRLTTSRSVYDRLNTNAAAVRIMDVHPLDGIGWGRFIEVSHDWVRQADTYPVTNVSIEVHNVFLSRAAETGIPGALLWGLAMLLGPVAVVLHRSTNPEQLLWRLAAIAAIILWLGPSLGSPNGYPLPNNLVWLIGGVAGRHMLVHVRRVPAAASDTT